MARRLTRGFERIWPLLAAWALAPAPVARAQQQVDQKELIASGFFQDFDELDLESLLDAGEVQVFLASGRGAGVDRAPGVVSILTREEILNLGVRTLEDALTYLPGVDVQRDGLGRTRIALRGVGLGSPANGSESVLVLLNGVALVDPISGGATAVNLDIPVEDVERLELLRGPGSTLFGGGALVGVISVTTRLGDAQSVIELSAAAGSFGTQRHHIRIGSATGDLLLSGFVQFHDSDGAELLVPRDSQSRLDAELAGQGIAAVSMAPGLADTRRRGVETSYRVGYRDIEASFRYKREIGGNFVGFNDALGTNGDLDDKQLLLDVSWRRDAAGGELKVHGGFVQSQRLEVQSAAPPGFTLPGEAPVRFPSGVLFQSRMRGRRLGAEGRYDRELGLEHQLLAGVSVQRESSLDPEALGNFDFRRRSPLSGFEPLDEVLKAVGRSVVAAWVQDTWSRDVWTVTGGLRVDHYGGTGASLSPRLSVVRELPSGTFLKALYGRSFRAPTLAELHFDLPGLFGNEALDPVRMDTIELAGFRRLGNLRLSANAFWSRLRDDIVPDGLATPLEPRPLVNGPGLDATGVELDLLREFGVSDSAFLGYTLQRATEAGSDRRAVGVPSQLLKAGASVAVGRHLTVTPSLRARSALPRAAGDARADVPGHVLADVSVRVRRIYRSLEIDLSAHNLLDDRWLDPAPAFGLPDDYPRPGFSIFVNARYAF